MNRRGRSERGYLDVTPKSATNPMSMRIPIARYMRLFFISVHPYMLLVSGVTIVSRVCWMNIRTNCDERRRRMSLERR